MEFWTYQKENQALLFQSEINLTNTGYQSTYRTKFQSPLNKENKKRNET